MNKEFTTVALDIHKIVDGKIKQTYHIEDWKTALEQMLYNKKAPCFGLYPDFTNFHVPKPIHKFYDHILSNPGTYGQNMTFINKFKLLNLKLIIEYGVPALRTTIVESKF